MAVDLEHKYKELILNLFPNGRAWNKLRNSKFTKLIETYSKEFVRVHKRVDQVLEEADPRTISETMDDWERVLGLPDSCTFGVDQSFEERKLTILQKLTTGGGANAAFFEEIATQFGYPDVKVTNYKRCRSGAARSGDSITNIGWEFVFRISSPDALAQTAKSGSAKSGDPIRKFGNPIMECVMQKLKPAHTTIDFSFGEN